MKCITDKFGKKLQLLQTTKNTNLSLAYVEVKLNFVLLVLGTGPNRPLSIAKNTHTTNHFPSLSFA